MLTRLVLFCVILVVLLQSCAVDLARRHSNKSSNTLFTLVSPDNVRTFVDVGLNSFTLKPVSPVDQSLTILDMATDGQAQLVKEVGAKTKTTDELLAGINTTFSFDKSPAPSTRIVPKTISKSLVFSIDRPYASAKPATPGSKPDYNDITVFNEVGDRISFLELSVTIPARQKGGFNSWDKFVTDYATVDLASVTSGNSWGATLAASAKVGAEATLTGTDGKSGSVTTKKGVVSDETGEVTTVNNSGGNSAKATSEVGGSASANFSGKYETSQGLTVQRLKLSGTLTPENLILRQEGVQGLDLSGNTVVAVEYALADDWAKPLQLIKWSSLTKNGKPVPVDSLTNSPYTLLYPDMKADLVGTLEYRFVYRQITSGSQYIPEARHTVTYKYGEVGFRNTMQAAKPTVLVKRSDVIPTTYKIASTGTSNTVRCKEKELHFETLKEAVTFHNYISRLVNSGGDVSKIKIGGDQLTPANFAALIILTQTNL